MVIESRHPQTSIAVSILTATGISLVVCTSNYPRSYYQPFACLLYVKRPLVIVALEGVHAEMEQPMEGAPQSLAQIVPQESLRYHHAPSRFQVTASNANYSSLSSDFTCLAKLSGSLNDSNHAAARQSSWAAMRTWSTRVLLASWHACVHSS